MMQIIFTIIRFLGFAVSVLGYVLFACKALHARIRHSFIFVLSSITCIIYFAGLVGLLELAVWVVFLGGIALVLCFIIHKSLSVVFNWHAANAINAVFLLALVLLFVSLYSAHFVHYDNFSHWGLVVKYMLMNGHFPDAGAAIIDFKTYPLGSSSFIYYFCRIVGHSEGMMMVAQALLMLACFFAMFSVVTDRRRLLLSALLGFLFSLMTYLNISIRMNNLLVDFLLPLLALAAVATMSMHRYHFKTLCLFSAPILGLLVITKNSGLFFAAICFVYFLYIAFHSGKYQAEAKRPRRVFAALGVIVLTLLPFFAWQLHTALVFPGENTKHTMSASNFQAVFSEKTPEIVQAVTRNYLSEVFSLNSASTVAILAFNAAAIAAYLIARFAFKKKWRLIYWLIALDAAVVLYYFGIWAMFLFTMPVEEALVLAGFERYASSMAIFFIGALAMCVAVDVEKSLYVQLGNQRNYRAFKTRLSKSAYQYTTLLLLCAMSIVLLSEINGMNSMKRDYPTSLPARVVDIVGDNWQETSGSRYLLYASDTDAQITSFYLQYVGRYYLFAPQVDATSGIETGSFAAVLDGYDYFVVIEVDPALEEMFFEHFGETAQPGIYAVPKMPPQ